MLAQIDDTLLLGPVKARIDTVLQGELIKERYLALPADIADWVDQAPSTPAAEQPA
jgi:hypothetical protein